MPTPPTILAFAGTAAGLTIEQKARLGRALRHFAPSSIQLADKDGANAECEKLIDELSPACEIVNMEPDPDACSLLIGCPKEAVDSKSETWRTINKARRSGRLVYVILPSGGVKRFEASPVEHWAVMPYSSESIEFHAAILKFAELAYLNAGKPSGFAVYREQPTVIEGKTGAYYFSPVAGKLCIGFIKGNSGWELDAPDVDVMERVLPLRG